MSVQAKTILTGDLGSPFTTPVAGSRRGPPRPLPAQASGLSPTAGPESKRLRLHAEATPVGGPHGGDLREVASDRGSQDNWKT